MIVNSKKEYEDTNPTHKVDLYLNFCFSSKKYHFTGSKGGKILDYCQIITSRRPWSGIYCRTGS